jgi:hypothetical protein
MLFTQGIVTVSGRNQPLAGGELSKAKKSVSLTFITSFDKIIKAIDNFDKNLQDRGKRKGL